MVDQGGTTTVKEEKNCVSVLLFWDKLDFVRKGGRKGDIPVALGYTLVSSRIVLKIHMKKYLRIKVPLRVNMLDMM